MKAMLMARGVTRRRDSRKRQGRFAGEANIHADQPPPREKSMAALQILWL
jgi:hypothetical protein